MNREQEAYVLASMQWQNTVLSQLRTGMREVTKAIGRIENNQGGTIDPDLQRAIARLSAKSELLQEAINEAQEPSTVGGSQSVSVTWSYKMSADLSDEIADIEKSITVAESATKLVNSIPALVEKAKNDALANGATAEQLQPLSDLVATLRAKSQELADAVVANTPAEE